MSNTERDNPPARTIVVADDDPDIRRLVAFTMRRQSMRQLFSRIRSKVIVLALAATLVATFAGGTGAIASPADEARIVELINAERATHGLAPVDRNATLGVAAQNYAAYMADADFFSHRGLDGSGLVSRAEAAGYNNWLFLAENLAGGQTTPERAVEAWMKSPGHRANVLTTEATEVGVGHAYNAGAKYRHYWALEMGRGLVVAQTPSITQ